MGMYCPYCHTRVSHKWHIQYVFCSDHCRIKFIEKFQQIKLPYNFNGSKSKQKAWRRRHKKYLQVHNPASLINNHVDSTPKALDQCVQTDCLMAEGN